ncbi:MAG TPA: hypothetical protein VGW39_01985 [Chthoniobacterales bacterium]|nr:hypothetical protein [Chthoniobacterales bacterium]
MPTLRADLPLGPTEDHEVRSANGRYLAKLTVAPPNIAVFAVNEGGDVPIWSMDAGSVLDDEHRTMLLDNDGQSVVLAYINYIWNDYSPDVVMVHFINRGRVVRQVTLGELLPDLSKLERTTSHFSWGRFNGINDHGQFIALPVDYRALYFDVATGQLVKNRKLYSLLAYDFLDFRRGSPGFPGLIISCVLGIIVGLALRRRPLFALATSLLLSAGIVIFYLWYENVFEAWSRPEADLWPAVAFDAAPLARGYRWEQVSLVPIIVVYLLPTIISAIMVSLLWPLLGRRPAPFRAAT